MILLLYSTCKNSYAFFQGISSIDRRHSVVYNEAGAGRCEMAFIVYRKNKKTGMTYAYRSESYRDPKTKKPKSRRTYLGRVDPSTGTIIPKGPAGTRNNSPLEQTGGETTDPRLEDLVLGLEKEIDCLRKENEAYRKQLEELSRIIKKAAVIAESGLGSNETK